MTDDQKYIYGIHTCNAQLRLDPQSIEILYLKNTSHSKQILKIIDNCKLVGINIVQLDKDQLTLMCLSSKHQGIVMKLSSNNYSGFDLDLYLQKESSPFIVIFDSLQDPRNLGSCIRSANAAGVELVIKRKSNSCEISPLVHKTASGGLQGLSLFETNNILSIIKKLKKNNIMIIGTADTGSKSIYNLDGINGAGIAVIIGAEGEGISKSLLDACDTVCSIPIYGTVECLNVAVATGITLYHIKKLLKKIE